MDFSLTVTMGAYNNKLWYILIILVIVIKIAQSNENGTTADSRRGRVSGRIVKLYSGIKNDPILCPKEGFLADPVDCSVFYRCLKASNGKYTVFRFQCGPGTVYDPETEVCNHPHSTKRTECGGFITFVDNNKDNEIEGLQPELPSPITTKLPIINENPVTKDPISVLSPNKNEFTTKIPDFFNAYSPVMQTQTIYQQDAHTSQSPFNTWTTTHQNSDSKETNINSQTNSLCTTEGFIGDTNNCRKFYRCVNNQHGGFIRYEFMCSNLTVWDDDTQGCNHVWAARNRRCGKDSMNELTQLNPFIQNTNSENFSGNGQKETQSIFSNEIYESQKPIDYNLNQNHAQYGDKISNDIKKSTLFQNWNSISSTTQISYIQPQINYDNNEKYPQQLNTSSETVNDVIITSSSTLAYENEKKQNLDSVNDLKGNTCTNSGFISDVNDCTKFYRCVYNGRGTFAKYEFTCSPGTVWDRKLEACNYAWSVKDCRNKENELVNGGNSTQYQTSSVNPLTIFNESAMEFMGYGNQYTTENYEHDSSKENSTLLSSGNLYPDAEKCKQSGFIVDTSNCQIFYKCIDNGRGGFSKHLYKCDEGTLWDSNIKACNYAYLVKSCNQQHNNAVTTIQSGVITPTSLVQTSTRYENNVVTTIQSGVITPTSLVQTTTKKNRLDNDYDVGYGQRIPIKNQLSSTVKTPNSKNICTDSGFVSDMKDCKKFYRCVDNSNGGFTQYEFSCGEGTVWDPSIEACNHVWAVKSCGNVDQITIPPSTSHSSAYVNDDENKISENYLADTTSIKPSTSMLDINENKCYKSGFMGDNNDCKKFYRCVDDGNGGYIKYQFVCGEGTVWDSKIEACNHKEAVGQDCSRSIENNEESITHPSTSFVADNHQTTNNSPPEAITQKTSTMDAVIANLTPNNENTSPFESITQKTSTINTGVTDLSPGDDIDKCKTDGFMENSQDCRKFYRCVSDDRGSYARYEFSCGEGTVWDQRIQGCNHEPEDGTCKINNDILKTTQGYTEEHIDNNSHLPSPTISIEDFPGTSSLMPQTSKPDTMCTSEGFYPDGRDCQKFHRCVDNGQGSFTKYEFTCGEGTVWNQEIKSCNHGSNNKDCKKNINSNLPQKVSTNAYPSSSSVTQLQQSTEQTLPPHENYCTSDGFYADKNDCKKFYRCVEDGNGGYTKYDFSCAEGTVWRQLKQVCDHDNGFSQCSTENSTNGSESSIEEHNSPSSTTTIMTPNYNSPSTSTTITPNYNSPSTITTTLITPDAYPEKENDEYDSNECTVEGFFPNENDCRQFYRCVYNEDDKYTKYEFSCGEGTAWDINIRSCNHINEVKSCQDDQYPSQDSQVEPVVEDEQVPTKSSESTSTIKVTSTTSTTPLTSASNNNKDVCNDDGFFGNSEDCKKFYRCVSNNDEYTKYDFICGDGTIWDQDILACNHPQDVTNPSCNSTNDNSSVDTDSSSSTSTSSTLPSSSSSPPPSSTTTISSSSSQVTSEMTTSSVRTSTTEAEDSSNKPDNQNYTCTKAGFYADPNDCKKFYRCVDWDNNGERFSIYHFECGEGTLWDPSLETCNHENSIYPPRDCSASQQHENSTQEPPNTVTEVSQTSESASETTTQQLTTETTTTSTEKSSTDMSTTQTSTTKNTTPSSTTKQTTTTQSSTSQSTTEQTSTQASSTSEQTTKSSTTETNTSTDKSTTTSEYETTTLQQTSTTSDTSEMTTSTPTSTTSEQTTEQNTQTTKDESSSTTEKTTTSEQTTLQSTQTTKDESSSTTEKTTTQPSSTEEQTTENQSSSSTTAESSQESTTQTTASEKECPETKDDENLYVCPTSFKRHPKYCNMFYQCTEEDDSHDLKIATFQCPNNTIYDESKIQCVNEKKAEKKCNGEIAQKRRVKRLDGNFKEPIIVTEEKLGCPSSGHFIFEKHEECSSVFLRCEFTKSGILQGYIYRCPEGYVYWTISRKCEAISRVKDCRRSRFDWRERHEIPIETLNVAYTNIK